MEAFGGACDVLLRLRRLGSTHPANFRRLEALSRYDATPAETTIELADDGSYRLADNVGAVTQAAIGRQLVEVLPHDLDTAKTALELANSIHQPRRSVDRVLQELITVGEVTRVGSGVKGCAFKYYKSAGKEPIQ